MKRSKVPDDQNQPARQHDLDFLFGTWTEEEADEFDQALAEQRLIEPSLWQNLNASGSGRTGRS